MEDADRKKDATVIQWHPAFVVALKGLFIDYRDVLEYKLEHPLSTGPLRIDILVVKKRPDAVVKRQIAEIFRQENIIEYKSPSDSLSVNEFYRAFARAHLYKAHDDVDIAGLTLSFVVASHPRELFRHMRETLGYAIEERHPGVFVITGAIIPIQIIDTRKLSEDENLWFRNLNRNLSEKSLLWVYGMKQKHGEQLDLNAWLYAVFTANQKKLEEVMNKEEYRMLTTGMRKTIENLGWGEQWRQEGIEEGRLKAARAMLAEGINIEIISRVTEIPLKTLKALKKKLSIQ